jgi:hypothetical protein
MQKSVAFTIVSDNYYYPVGTHIFVNTFKKFHPDIPLVVFRQDKIDELMVDGVNFYNAKPVFAKQLYNDYDLVVNIDADTIILDRLTEVFDQDYDVGAVWNFNDYENVALENITSEMYVQAGLVASRSKFFWDLWANKNQEAMQYRCQENDILNLLWYNNEEVQKMNKIIFDKDKNYLGCKSLGREGEFYLDGNKIFCRGEQVKAYHHARGGGALPKLQLEKMGFPYQVTEYMKHIAYKGVTVKYETI